MSRWASILSGSRANLNAGGGLYFGSGSTLMDTRPRPPRPPYYEELRLCVCRYDPALSEASQTMLTAGRMGINTRGRVWRRRLPPGWPREVDIVRLPSWTPWLRAAEADQCWVAMLGLARWLPRDLCWAVVCRLVLAGPPPALVLRRAQALAPNSAPVRACALLFGRPRVWNFGPDQTPAERAAAVATVPPRVQGVALRALRKYVLPGYLAGDGRRALLRDSRHAGRPLGYFMAADSEELDSIYDAPVRRASSEWCLIAYEGPAGVLVDLHGWPSGGIAEDGVGVFCDVATGRLTRVFSNAGGSLSLTRRRAPLDPGVERAVKGVIAQYAVHRRVLPAG